MDKTNAWSADPLTGAFKINFPSLPFFGRGSSTEAESVANLFVLRLLEVMHNLGYEFILSSDLSSIHGQSSLFFRLADEVNSLIQYIYVAGNWGNQAFPEIPRHFRKSLGNSGNA